MNREFKKTFLTSLLVVLLVISNLIGLKLTNFLDLTISVNFLTYPFTFLCTLLLMNIGGKKSAYQGILIAVFIQIFMTISYTMAVKLGNQTLVPDMAIYVNEVFKVNQLNILASVVSFLTSHGALIYIYDNFKSFGKELYGVAMGLLGALFLNATIYLVVTLNDYDIMFLINMLLSNIIISVIMIVIITILFYILKEKEPEAISIDNMDIHVTNYSNNDLAIEDVITSKDKDTKKNTNKKNKKQTSHTNNYHKPTGNKSNKTTPGKKKSKTSQTKVNKNDK